MMKKLAVAVLAVAAALPAMARDTEYKLPIADVLADGQGKLDPEIKLHFKGQPALKIVERRGEGMSNKKTNGVGKEDQFGCRWAALSALLALQEDAKRHGANAVVDIVSYYKKDTFSNANEYECHAGAVIIGVTFKGSYAKVK